MNRDNFLFATIGLLTGFILGYVLHEVMTARQPPRRVFGQAEAVTPGNPAPPGAGPSTGAAPPADAAAPAMAEVRALRQRLAENPDDADATRRLANMHYDIQNWERAAELYQRFLELRPGDLNVMTDLGAVYRYLGEPQRALELFEEVRTIQPAHWQARFNEILVLAFDLEDLVTATAALADLEALQPNNPDVERLAAELAKRRQGS